MIRINENLMQFSTIDWLEGDPNQGSTLFNSTNYPLTKPPVSGILSISADVEFITPDPENISAFVWVKDFTDSSFRSIGVETVPYTAGHRVKFEGLFDTGQVYEAVIGIYIGERGKTDGNIGRIRRIKVEDGGVCTMWVPPESTLTPEQIATLPPYGEYKEIKSF